MNYIGREASIAGAADRMSSPSLRAAMHPSDEALLFTPAIQDCLTHQHKRTDTVRTSESPHFGRSTTASPDLQRSKTSTTPMDLSEHRTSMEGDVGWKQCSSRLTSRPHHFSVLSYSVCAAALSCF